MVPNLLRLMPLDSLKFCPIAYAWLSGYTVQLTAAFQRLPGTPVNQPSLSGYTFVIVH